MNRTENPGGASSRTTARAAEYDGLSMQPQVMLDLARKAAELVVERIENLPRGDRLGRRFPRSPGKQADAGSAGGRPAGHGGVAADHFHRAAQGNLLKCELGLHGPARLPWRRTTMARRTWRRRLPGAPRPLQTERGFSRVATPVTASIEIGSVARARRDSTGKRRTPSSSLLPYRGGKSGAARSGTMSAAQPASARNGPNGTG